MVTNNFFDAIKTKSEAMNKSRAAEKLSGSSSGKIVDNLVSGKRWDDGIGDKPISNHLYRLSEIAGGKSWSEAEVTAPEVLAAAGVPAEIEGQAVQIEHILSANPVEFRLFFPSKPSALIRRDLLDAGFRWEPDRFYWYGTDTPEHRAFLKRIFSFSAGDAASLDTAAAEAEGDDIPAEKYEVQVPEPETVETRPELPEIVPVPMAAGVSVELQAFETYKQQVQELCAYLKVDAADLPLVAVGYLHKSVFSQQ